jgi:LacI family gluconate utilization system Gnt-I transcriptional repressor
MGDRNPPKRRRVYGASPAVTLADVAKLAEVSEITVSRILRDVGPVSEATRKRVLAGRWLRPPRT